MTDSERFVLSKHPKAFDCFNNDRQTWKIFDSRSTWTALSKSFPTEVEAWQDAELAIKVRDHVPEEVLVTDQR